MFKLSVKRTTVVLRGRRFQSSLSVGEKKKVTDLNASETIKSKGNTNVIKAKSQRCKQGFSTVDKVPSTMDLEPKHILLDKLYQGYKPLMLPHSPNMLQDSNGKKPLFINILEGISLEDYEKGVEIEGEEDEAYHTPTMMISKYIFNKNPETEKKLQALSQSASEAETEVDNKLAAVKNMFTKRQQSKRGRVRLQYKKNSNKK